MLLGLQRPSKPLRDENGLKVRNKMERSLMLPLRYIFAHTNKGDWVVDLFGGYIPPLFVSLFIFIYFFPSPFFFQAHTLRPKLVFAQIGRFLRVSQTRLVLCHSACSLVCKTCEFLIFVEVS